MARFYVSKNSTWTQIQVVESGQADLEYLKTTGGTMAGNLNLAANRLQNLLYSGAGPTGAVVTPVDLATIQYTDDLVTVTTTPGLPTTPPLRDGQIWMVAADKPLRTWAEITTAEKTWTTVRQQTWAQITANGVPA